MSVERMPGSFLKSVGEGEAGDFEKKHDTDAKRENDWVERFHTG
jgi:hypothetical protein